MYQVQLRNPHYPNDRLASCIADILDKERLCSMATVSPMGESHIHTAYFCVSDVLEIYFSSNPSTDHGQYLKRFPNAAMAVFDSAQPWDEYHRGLQLFGECRLVSNEMSSIAFDLYKDRFPDYGEYVNSLTVEERNSSPYRFYMFIPTKIKILDEQEFGEENFVVVDILREER